MCLSGHILRGEFQSLKERKTGRLNLGRLRAT